MGLIAIIVEAHGDDRAALGEHTFGKIGWTLRNKAKRHAIFTTFLGDPAEDVAHGGFRIDMIGRDVPVRLFADEQDRALRFIARPDCIIEHHS
jgi:hypothetical protein